MDVSQRKTTVEKVGGDRKLQTQSLRKFSKDLEGSGAKGMNKKATVFQPSMKTNVVAFTPKVSTGFS